MKDSQSDTLLGVIFDMDGVLVDSYAAHLESWRRLATEIGATIGETQFAATFGRTSRDIIEDLFGVADPAAIRKYDDRKEAIYRDVIRGHVPVMPGSLNLVRDLHAAGFKLAIGSSGPAENIDLVCAEAGLNEYICAKVTGLDVARGKPDPEVFLLAADRMGVAPNRCTVIEDAPAGIEAARRAGMACIALAGTHAEEHLAMADRVVTHLDHIKAADIRRLPT